VKVVCGNIGIACLTP
ncbi:DUF3265 domain-containing protein, partial [Vibrio parahaemolyticus]|nr:DUF3265 domain-containing protein [Vibrio parahaemolyticus]